MHNKQCHCFTLTSPLIMMAIWNGFFCFTLIFTTINICCKDGMDTFRSSYFIGHSFFDIMGFCAGNNDVRFSNM